MMITRPSDLVFEAMKVEYNPVQKKYFVYAKVVNQFDKREDYHPADYDVFVFDEFNPDTADANTFLHFCNIVYYDEFADEPAISHMFLTKDISKVFTNAYEDSDMAIAVYTAMQKDYINQKVVDKIAEDTNTLFDDLDQDVRDDYSEWPDDWDIDEEDDGYFGLKSPTPDISFTNICYAVSYDNSGQKVLFHIYTSSLGVNSDDVDSTIELVCPPEEECTTVFWVNHNNQIFPIKIPVDKEWIFHSISNIHLFKEDAIANAMANVDSESANKDAVDGYITNIDSDPNNYTISYISSKSNKLRTAKLETVPKWVKPTSIEGFNLNFQIVVADTSATISFVALGDSKDDIVRIATRKPIGMRFENVFPTRKMAEDYYDSAPEFANKHYNLLEEQLNMIKDSLKSLDKREKEGDSE